MSDTGSVTIPLFYCVFNDGGSITHWDMHFDRGLYDSLPNLYLVCLVDSDVQPRKVVGAFMVRTSRHHDDDGFLDAVSGAMHPMERLQPLIGPGTSLLPARIGLVGAPPTETEFVELAFQQWTKFSVGGRA